MGRESFHYTPPPPELYEVAFQSLAEKNSGSPGALVVSFPPRAILPFQVFGGPQEARSKRGNRYILRFDVRIPGNVSAMEL